MHADVRERFRGLLHDLRAAVVEQRDEHLDAAPLAHKALILRVYSEIRERVRREPLHLGVRRARQRQKKLQPAQLHDVHLTRRVHRLVRQALRHLALQRRLCGGGVDDEAPQVPPQIVHEPRHLLVPSAHRRAQNE